VKIHEWSLFDKTVAKKQVAETRQVRDKKTVQVFYAPLKNDLPES
jgi:hypothetical protein